MDTQTESPQVMVPAAIENTSGQGAAAVVPLEIKGWSWGGFLLTWIWGIFNGTFITLLMFIPLVNIVMWFIIGAKGREWAWRNKRWESVEHFKKVQRQWGIAGLVFVVAFAPAIFGIFATTVLLQLNVARSKARDAMRITDVMQIQTAVELYYDDNGSYPPDISDKTMGLYFEGGSVFRNRFTDEPYGYGFNGATQEYQLYANLENESSVLYKDDDIDASRWSPTPGVNGADGCAVSARCTNHIFDISNIDISD